MARLGRIYHRPQRQLVTAFGPAVYQDLLVIPRSDLPSGAGVGKDYVVVFMAQVGPIWCNGGFQAENLFRIGMRYPGNQELSLTWSDFWFPHHLMFLRARPGNELSHYVFCVRYIRDFPTTHDLHISAQHVASQFFTCETQVQDLCAIVLDCTAFGGSRVGNGWEGSRLIVRDLTGPFSGGTISGAGWYAASHLARATRQMRFTLSGSSDAGANVYRSQILYTNRADAFSDRQDYICHGSWTNVPAGTFPNSTSSLQNAASLGGYSVTVDLSTLDNAGVSAYQALDLAGIGRVVNDSNVTREYAFPVTRPSSEVLQLVRASASFADLGRGTIQRAVAAHALQNSWGASGTPILQRTGSFGLLDDILPLHAAAYTPQGGFTVPVGSAILATDRFALPDFVGSQTLTPAGEIQAVQFSLTDDGPLPPPAAVTFTDVELVPSYEADLDSLPDLAAPMRAVGPYDAQGEGKTMLTAGQYEIRHGGISQERRVVQVVGESLTMADVEALRQQADEATAFKFALDDGVVRAWRFVPGSLTWSESSNGLVTVSATLVQHIYLAP